MTLGERIARAIRLGGPMALADFMQIALAERAAGYYRLARRIGPEGDFVTAPEISQIFGELLGVWCLAMWQALGRPAPFTLAEAGPGRGLLMADLLRATRTSHAFRQAARLVLIETSEGMAQAQRAALAGVCDPEPVWVERIEHLPDAPLILIGNEFLDCLPIRQFVARNGHWHERLVALDEAGRLAWRLGPPLPPEGHPPCPADGAVREVSPAREAWTGELVERIRRGGGAALLIDYGFEGPALGDTFQALAGHRPVDPLSAPGEADLTAHVDFAPLLAIARTAGLAVAPLTPQGEFLLSMGLLERAGRLGASRDEAARDVIRRQVGRLAAPVGMGSLFKVMALAEPDAVPALPPFLPTASPR